MNTLIAMFGKLLGRKSVSGGGKRPLPVAGGWSGACVWSRSNNGSCCR